MGIFANAKAAKDVQRIKAGGTAQLSNSQIVNLIINLPDANRNLSPEQFKQVYSLFREISKDTTKREMNYSEYFAAASAIVERFELIAPYDLYSGDR